MDANLGAVYGLVSDPAGAPIPKARVLAIQASTGLERETFTDEEGRFRIAALIPGAYELRVTSAAVGAIIRDVNVRVGASVQLNVTVALTNVNETVDVTTSVLSVADAGLTQVIPFSPIRDLPINGRRFQEFAILTPAVQAGPETLSQLSFVGQRGVNANVLLDGTDYNEPFLGGIRGGDRSGLAFTIPQTAVAEFQTVTSGYSAEYGRSTGGVLNAITRSGSNSYHGDAFYLIRDDSLSRANPLGRSTLERQQQFGGGAGGPVMRNRLFFFGAAEQQFSRLPRQVQFSQLPDRPSPDIAPAYEFFRAQERAYTQTNDATAALGRGDLYLGGSHTLTGRYQYSRNNAENAAATGMSLEPVTNSALSANGTDWDTIRTIGGQLTSVFRPGLINDLRVQHSFEHRRRIPNGLTPRVEASALGIIGTPTLLPYRLRDRRLQIADGMTAMIGAHALKVGFDYSYIDFYQWFGDHQTGAFTISNPDVMEVLRILSRSGGPSGNRFDDPSVVYRRQMGVLALEGVAHQLAFFAQDTWRVHRNVTLNAGLRWEGQLNPRPDTSNQTLTNAVRDFQFPLGRLDPGQLGNYLNQWAPRFGIAWNPGGRATVLRAQTGIFYGQLPLTMLIGPLGSFSTAPPDVSLEIAPGARGTVYDQFLAAGIDLNTVSLGQLPLLQRDAVQRISGRPDFFTGSNVVTMSGDNFRNPRATQVSLGVQHQIARGLAVDYQWNFVNTNHLLRNIDYNVPFPRIRAGDVSERPFFGLRSGTPRPNSQVGQVLVRDSGARSRYNGHSFRVQLTRSRLELAANYTLSWNKSDDDNERAISGITYGNPFDLSREYHWSALDARHLASGYALIRAPMGFDFTTLFRYRSALPIDPTTGEDSAELLTGSVGNRPFERPGVPYLRNSFRNRDFKTVDLRILKSIAGSERMRVQLSAEVFNVFNFDNVAFLPAIVQPDNPAFVYGPGILPNGQMAPVAPGFLQLRNASGAYNPGVAGQTGVPLMAQLGLRLLF